jgi:hypothetical protein
MGRKINFHSPAKAAQIAVDAVLRFYSESELQEWIESLNAREFARDNPLVAAPESFPTRYFYIVQGRIVEAVIEPMPPRQPPGSVQVGGDREPLIRKTLEP